MAKVKVWNDNDHVHQEDYKGDRIVIQPHGYVEMDWEEGIQFQGQFTPIKFLADGIAPDPRCYKMIRVDAPTEPIFRDNSNIVHATGQRAASASELVDLLKTFAAEQPDRVVKADDKELDSLKAQVAYLKNAVTELMSRKKPGRPPKEAR